MGYLNTMKNNKIQSFVIKKTDEIKESIKKNTTKIKKIDILMKKTNISTMKPIEQEGLKNHVLWCHKEMLELYKQYERMLSITKKQTDKIFGSKKVKKPTIKKK